MREKRESIQMDQGSDCLASRYVGERTIARVVELKVPYTYIVICTIHIIHACHALYPVYALPITYTKLYLPALQDASLVREGGGAQANRDFWVVVWIQWE